MSFYDSIDPENKTKGLLRQWDVAAVDLPVPADLVGHKAAAQWHSYLNCLPPTQQIRKLGQALDQFHALVDAKQSLMTLSEDEQREIYSKWHAAAIATAVVATRLQFSTQKRDSFKSDISMGLFFLNDFLAGVNSYDLMKWQERASRHREIDENDSELGKLVGKFCDMFKKDGEGPKPTP